MCTHASTLRKLKTEINKPCSRHSKLCRWCQPPSTFRNLSPALATLKGHGAAGPSPLTPQCSYWLTAQSHWLEFRGKICLAREARQRFLEAPFFQRGLPFLVSCRGNPKGRGSCPGPRCWVDGDSVPKAGDGGHNLKRRPRHENSLL